MEDSREDRRAALLVRRAAREELFRERSAWREEASAERVESVEERAVMRSRRSRGEGWFKDPFRDVVVARKDLERFAASAVREVTSAVEASVTDGDDIQMNANCDLTEARGRDWTWT